MDIQEEDKEKLRFFIRTGIVVLSFLVICAVGVKYIPKAIYVANFIHSKDLPIYCVNTEEKKIALTFDSAWGNEDIDDILKILDKHKVKVTFFMTGGWVEKYPEDVKAIVAAGHDIGNHGENHKHMSQLTKEQSIEEIMKLHNKVKDLTGIEMNLFRPPYGDFNETVLKASREAGYYSIQWDVDSLDWKDYGVESIVNTVVNHKHLGNGSIVLLHNGTKHTKDALDSLIVGLKDKGYELVPVSQLIYTGEYYMDQEGRQYKKN